MAVYFGNISKEITEQILNKYGKNGSFLLRDSESVRGAICLCVRRGQFIHTYRIEQSAKGWAAQTLRGSQPQWFQTVQELIACYMQLPPHNMVPLLHPLDNTLLNSMAASPFYMEM